MLRNIKILFHWIYVHFILTLILLFQILALALPVEGHLEHLHLVLVTILEVCLEIHRPNQVGALSGMQLVYL